MDTINRFFVGVSVTVGVLFVLILAGFLWFGAELGEEHPTDEYLARLFMKNRSSFEQIVTMSNQDARVIRIAPGFTRLDSNWGWPRADSLLGFSQNRWNEYRRLFRTLGLEDGLSREQEAAGSTTLYLIAHSRGMVNRGSSKGFAYSRIPLGPLLPSLDGDLTAVRREHKHGVAYRALSDGWYLALDW